MVNPNLKLVREEEDILYDEERIEEKTQEPEETSMEILDPEIPLGISLDALIDELPGTFPEAYPLIKNDIAPLICACDPGLEEHYITRIKKKIKDTSKKAIKDVIKDTRKQLEIDSIQNEVFATSDEKEEDPEIINMAQALSQDPAIFLKRIEAVQHTGVIGEKKTIATYLTVMDSRLLPMGIAGSEALAMKNAGPFGAGKSFPLLSFLKLFPKTTYEILTSGSEKNIYYMAKDALKNKTLVLTEALSLQNDQKDNNFTLAVRSLISEGFLKYYVTDPGKITIARIIEGPTSVITTTIYGKLEEQLEDRLITVCPDTSSRQTEKIMQKSAEIAEGFYNQIDEMAIRAWQHFHGSLKTCEVIIPFAKKIADLIIIKESAPITARRGFKRVLSVIKTIALLHQHQRCHDEQGRLIADYIDYALSYQVIHKHFEESLGQGKKLSDPKIKMIEKHGPITPRDLAKSAQISGAAISQWTAEWINKGVLVWVDENGNPISDEASLSKAKRTGKAYLRVSTLHKLPTPYQLSGDKAWDIGGELYERYDLKFEDDENIIKIESSGDEKEFEPEGGGEGEGEGEGEGKGEGDKVLSENPPHKIENDHGYGDSSAQEIPNYEVRSDAVDIKENINKLFEDYSLTL